MFVFDNRHEDRVQTDGKIVFNDRHEDRAQADGKIVFNDRHEDYIQRCKDCIQRSSRRSYSTQ
jgi:hypothetical protein